MGTIGRSNPHPLEERKPCRVILKIMTSDDDDGLYCPGDTRQTEAFDRSEKTQR